MRRAGKSLSLGTRTVKISKTPIRVAGKYLVVGIWNSIFGIGTFLILSWAFPNLFDALVLFLSYLISIVQAHLSQRMLVWKSQESYFPELLRFSGAYISQFFVNLILLQIFVHFIGLSRSVSQTSIVVLLTVVMYFVNKNGVFRVNKEPV